LVIREAKDNDFDYIWPIFRSIVSAQETYTFDANTGKDKAYTLWLEVPQMTYVADDCGKIFGTYYLKPNMAGPGSHVCNCGYMVSETAGGKGIAGMMCEHSQKEAVRLGYKAMQFNCVVSSNGAAVHLWKKHGFEIVGTLPKAYKHLKLGYVDCYVMYKWLD